MVRLVLLLAVIAVAGCSPWQGEEGARLSPEQLRAMALPLSEFGPAYASARIAPDAGEQDAVAIIALSADPPDEAEDVQRFGKVLRYLASFTSDEAIVRARGAFSFGSSVTLYRSEEGASGDLADHLADLKRQVSGTTDLGTLHSFAEFEVPSGKRGYGVSVRLLAQAETFGFSRPATVTVTMAGFQRGPVVGQVVVMRFGADDVRAEVRELARRLDRRVAAVLAGKTPEPDGLPGPGPLPSSVR
ncbi:MAG TPA: hypothetical protein VNN10_08145 [Dehalococcoidia bacterium]|nr:hypothetical protein [Dehalococcoidia bacterium]